jgi:SAM-dependent methyltransferase
MSLTTQESPETAIGKVQSSSQCPLCGHGDVRTFLQAPDRYHGRHVVYELMRCGSCSVVWLKDPPQPSEMAQHYGSNYDAMIATSGEEAIEAYWRGPRGTLLKHKSGGSILDMGCSSGGFLSSLDRSAWKLHGIEISSEVAQRARAATGAEVYVGDVPDAPYLPASFDAITCFHVFEHMYHPRKVMSKVYEWLRPGGVFVTYMPNIDSAGRRIFGSYWYALELPRHLHHFSPESLSRLATSVGMEKLSITTDREVFIESSCRYILDEGLRRMGVRRTPMAEAKVPGLPFRVLRKGFRMTALPLLEAAAGMAGDGETIHAVFRKPD